MNPTKNTVGNYENYEILWILQHQFFKIPHKISYKMLKINFILIKNEKNLLLKVAAVTKAQKMNR